MKEFKTFINEAGAKNEEQETALIKAITEVCKNYKNYNVCLKLSQESNATILENVTGANKVSGTNSYGKEPYPDIQIQANNKTYNVSCKGKSAPSFAGGGLIGLLSIDKNETERIINKAFEEKKREYEALEKQGKQDNWKWKDVFIPLSGSFVDEVLIGNDKIGGKIDFMYIGEKKSTNYKTEEVKNKDGKIVKVIMTFTTGRFYSVPKEVKSVYPSMELRIRCRETHGSKIFFDKTGKNKKDGLPNFIVDEKGSPKRRIVLVAKHR